MADLSARDTAARSSHAAPMAPRAALKRPDAARPGQPAPANNRHVGFEALARAKPADGGDSFATQVKFMERTDRRRGASSSSSSQASTPPSPSRSPSASAGQPGKSGKSAGGFMSKLFGGGRRDAGPAVTTAAATVPTGVPRQHLPTAATFNDLMRDFLNSGADEGQKMRLREALARGAKGAGGAAGFREFLDRDFNTIVDEEAAQIMLDAVNVFHKLSPQDRSGIRSAAHRPADPAGRSRPTAASTSPTAATAAAGPSRKPESPASRFNNLMRDFMNSGADESQKRRLGEALAFGAKGFGGAEGFREFIGKGEYNNILDPGAGRIMKDAIKALHKLRPEDDAEIKMVPYKPLRPAGR